MSRYVYSLHDYHAVKRAVIAIDGITVLSGENGCGKSTLSKWLYYLVNGAEHFDVYIYNSFIRGLQERISRLNMVRREIDRYNDNANHTFFREGEMKLRRLYSDESHENIDNAIIIFDTILDRFVKILSDYLKHKPSERVKERMLRYLDIEIQDNDHIDDELETFAFQQNIEIHKLYDRYIADKDERNKERFFSLLHTTYDIKDKPPVNIQLEEEEVKLFKKNRTGSLFNLSRAIYVDTPMAISEEIAYDNKFWDNLQNLMMYPAKDMQISERALKIGRRINKLIKGQVKVRQDDFNQDELHYIREDGLDIKLDDVATGFKSFSYIQRLLDNGYLNANTLLMIDEPEAHLHPQWIVEFARLLVLLNKELGVKIMVASHNPDMVAAIQAISRKEELTDVTRFYIAESSETPYKYSYRDLGNDIEDIFKSFNIAYERIEQYGGTGI
ncbi:AAA family ATPase [Xylanibacter caecicola]|uniref:AAA family ATPase n=1 Tax=Xylanibacter caecicola TaxID=2736294 RepID=UPI0025845181|nr:AAA family ATPase [Xylanibacter caecicola]